MKLNGTEPFFDGDFKINGLLQLQKAFCFLQKQ